MQRSCRRAPGRARRSPRASAWSCSRRCRAVDVGFDRDTIPDGAGESAGLEIAGRRWRSRLIVGTGGFASLELMERAVEASGSEIVTVALRRVDPEAPGSVI